jgi:hypothetical protein
VVLVLTVEAGGVEDAHPPPLQGVAVLRALGLPLGDELAQDRCAGVTAGTGTVHGRLHLVERLIAPQAAAGVEDPGDPDPVDAGITDAGEDGSAERLGSGPVDHGHVLGFEAAGGVDLDALQPRVGGPADHDVRPRQGQRRQRSVQLERRAPGGVAARQRQHRGMHRLVRVHRSRGEPPDATSDGDQQSRPSRPLQRELVDSRQRRLVRHDVPGRPGGQSLQHLQ